MLTTLPPFWQLFSELQHETNTSILNSRAWGMEEVLDTLLSEASEGGGACIPQAVLQRFNNLRSNRAAKYRRRHQILYEKRRDLEDWTSKPFDPSHIVLWKEQLEYLHPQSTPEEWRLLEALAAGYTYQELVEYLSITISNLKTKVSRLRRRIAQCSGGV